MKKRVLSLFLAITLCLTLTPTGALAAEGQPPEQTVSATQEAETDAGENASPANPEENPTEDALRIMEKALIIVHCISLFVSIKSFRRFWTQ